jgi:IstB-like ATP binding protein
LLSYVLFHVVNDRHLKKRPMIFTTNKPLNEWGKVLHDEDMAAAILDRVLERGRFIHLDGPSGRTRRLNLEETLPENTKRLRISGTHIRLCFSLTIKSNHRDGYATSTLYRPGSSCGSIAQFAALIKQIKMFLTVATTN